MNDRDYVISVVLTNEDWKAFTQVQPEPVSWLKEQIRQKIAAAAAQKAPQAKQTTAA